uniref:ARAD1C08690p n=1 Tax=Blastobotrys adeninivorans TaxID=409370 RepID=A0A060SZK2_BLAAD
MERRTGASSPRRTPSALVASRIQELERPHSQPSAVPRHHRSHSALDSAVTAASATCLVRTSSSLSGPRPQPVYQLDARPDLQPRYDPRLDARLDPRLERLDSGYDPRYDSRLDSYDPRDTSANSYRSERAEAPPATSAPTNTTSTSTSASTNTSTPTDPKPSIAMTIVAKVLPWMPASPTSFISGLLTGLTIAYLRPTLEAYLDIWAQYCATGLRLVIVWGSVAAVAIVAIKIMQRTGAAAQAISSSPPPQVKKKKDASIGYEDSEVPRMDHLSSPAVAPPAPPPAPPMPRASSPTASPQSWQLPGAFRASPEPYYVHTSHGNQHHHHNHHPGHDMSGRGSALSTRSAVSTRSDGSIVSYASCASDGSYETAYSQPAYVHSHHPRSHSHSHTPRPGTTAAAAASATRQASPVRRKISPPEGVSVLEKPANSAAFRLKAK